jgi:hypothetical protein
MVATIGIVFAPTLADPGDLLGTGDCLAMDSVAKVKKSAVFKIDARAGVTRKHPSRAPYRGWGNAW